MGFPGYTPSEPVPSLVQVLEGEPQANTPRIEVNNPARPDLPLLGWGQPDRAAGGDRPAGQAISTDHARAGAGTAGHGRQHFRAAAAGGLGTAGSHRPPYKGNPLPGRHHIYPEMAAAGLWTTPADLARVAWS